MLTGLDAAGQPFSASGRLVDTWVYDNFSSPAMQNMGDFAFAGTDYYYVNYAEGIYVGYRYYETRYEDVLTGRANAGDYDYSSTVLYPFGYRLSYTTFRWSDFTMSETEDHFLLLYSPSHGQVYSKKNLTGGAQQEFRIFLETRTGLTMQKI